eukprot:CAMPEP_0182550058 /NCGR_PEP_ID=MMETSP1323-20130603/41074_1 /TAXON_ID=236787 /ORGANISM="Florenciella parvula, Strain RCC1693" /LENGTH=180 /DNA_ID=CAMNT_0024761555 /DNA_START=43 /DNA_END=585 /DNA_ORIENTATION=+
MVPPRPVAAPPNLAAATTRVSRPPCGDQRWSFSSVLGCCYLRKWPHSNGHDPRPVTPGRDARGCAGWAHVSCLEVLRAVPSACRQVCPIFYIVKFPPDHGPVIVILPYFGGRSNERAVVNAPRLLLPHNPFTRCVTNEWLRFDGAGIVHEQARLLNGDAVHAPQHASIANSEGSACQVAG